LTAEVAGPNQWAPPMDWKVVQRLNVFVENDVLRKIGSVVGDHDGVDHVYAGGHYWRGSRLGNNVRGRAHGDVCGGRAVGGAAIRSGGSDVMEAEIVESRSVNWRFQTTFTVKRRFWRVGKIRGVGA